MDELNAAAAHVEHNAVLHGQTVDRPEEPEAGFLRSVGDVDRDAQLVTRALDESLAVAGFAHRSGGHGHGAVRAAAGGHGDEPADDAQGAIDGLRAELAGLGDVAHQTQRAARVAEDVEVRRAANARDQDAPAVGADVDDAEGLAATR